MHSLMDIRLKLKVEISKSVMVRAVTVDFGGCYKQEIHQKICSRKRRRYHENSSNV